jgi:hypothetical protein
VGSRFYLPDFLDQHVPLGTLRRILQLRSQAGLLGYELLFKGVGGGSTALLHGKTSSVRVLTAGFSGKCCAKIFGRPLSPVNLKLEGCRRPTDVLWVNRHGVGDAARPGYAAKSGVS